MEVGLPIVLGMAISTKGGIGAAGVAARVLLGKADGLGRKLETVMRSGVRC